MPLARFFLRGAPLVLSPEVCAWLEARRWQGNVRELQALIRFVAATVTRSIDFVSGRTPRD